jgi:hypothetical protein
MLGCEIDEEEEKCGAWLKGFVDALSLARLPSVWDRKKFLPCRHHQSSLEPKRRSLKLDELQPDTFCCISSHVSNIESDREPPQIPILPPTER